MKNNKDKIESQDELFALIVYYADYQDAWQMIKKAIQNETRKIAQEQTVEDTARFFLLHPGFGAADPKSQKIRKWYDTEFQLSKIDSSKDRHGQIELCPSEDGNSYFIRGGNTRLIVYAMKLLKKKEVFRPVRVGDYVNYFTRMDRRNFDGMETTQ